MQHKRASSRRLWFVAEEYMRAQNITDISQVDWDDFAKWAHANDKYRVVLPDPVQLIRRSVSRALRDSLELDKQERLIRRFHHVLIEDPITHEKIDRWVDITTAPPKQMKLSLTVRREAAFADVFQLKTDLDSYNDNNSFGAKLEMDFNYNLDLQERSLPGEYPVKPPDDDDDGNDDEE